MVAWPGGEPAFDLGMLVGAVVVDDEVDIEAGGHAGVNVLEEAQKLLVAMPRLALGDDLAGGHVQGGKEVGGTVTDVAMRDAFDVSEPEGQERLGSLQRLGLALLVNAEHHRVVGRVEVESDDIVDLLGEERIGGELEVLLPVRLDVERCPDAMDRGLRHPRRVCHGTATPVRAAVGRLGLERPLQQYHDFVIFDGPRLSRPAFVVQAHEASGSEALAPLADRLAAGTDPLGHRLVVQAIGAQKHDLGAAYHGRQGGRVYLADRAVRVERPRLRSPGEGELAIPAYEALRRPSGLGERMLELLLAGLSTRSYGKAIGEMAETAGVSKSSVSRQAAEAAGERLKELAERRLDDRDYLIVYVDGIQFGGHHVLAALGVDDKGNKRVLGLREGASENAVVALALLESLVERGLDPGRARLFVLDGSKALHKAVGQVFGSACLVQRCRNHKMRNVTGHLPKELHDQASAVLRAAWKLGAKDGKARIEQFASWVEKQHPDAAGSLREGLGEMFTVSEIGLTPALRRCLGTTNVIDNAHSGMRRRTGRVTRWRDGSMAVRWAAAAFLDAEKNYRRIMGYKDLWILKAHLDELGTPPVDGEEVAA